MCASMTVKWYTYNILGPRMESLVGGVRATVFKHDKTKRATVMAWQGSRNNSKSFMQLTKDQEHYSH